MSIVNRACGIDCAYDRASRPAPRQQGFYGGGFRADRTYDREGKVTGIKHQKSSWGESKGAAYDCADTGEPSRADIGLFAVYTAKWLIGRPLLAKT